MLDSIVQIQEIQISADNKSYIMLKRQFLPFRKTIKPTASKNENKKPKQLKNELLNIVVKPVSTLNRVRLIEFQHTPTLPLAIKERY